jgi:2-succinyl-6-hydroxy-2,4-cyclohexadiene-1-carboxylate synthase
VKIWALHGFLGEASDFDLLQKKSQQRMPGLRWQSVDYLKEPSLSPQTPLHLWGEAFNQYLQKFSDSTADNILLGYSQGGRLALHALKNRPDLWKAALLFSANPGIRDEEKSTRLAHDEKWVAQFLTEDFGSVLARWNSQQVFQGSQNEPMRKESRFDRDLIAQCLSQWSLARQEDFFSFLEDTSLPILYVAGERDRKYCQIGSRLQRLNSHLQLQTLPAAGHRVHFDQPEGLAELMVQFLETLK